MAVANRILGRDRELALVEEKLGSDGFHILGFSGPTGVGKTELLLQLAARADTHRRPWAMVSLDQPGADTRSMLSGLVKGLRAGPWSIKTTRYDVLERGLGAARLDEPPLTLGMTGALAAVSGHGALLRGIDVAAAALREIGEAVREVNVDRWLVENLSRQWRMDLFDQPAKRLIALLPVGLAHDLIDNRQEDEEPLLLMVDGLIPTSILDTALNQLASPLKAASTRGVLAVTSSSSVPDRPTKRSPVWFPTARLWGSTDMLQHSLDELASDNALKLLDDLQVPEGLHERVYRQIGGTPGALVAAGELLSFAPDDELALEALGPAAGETGPSHLQLHVSTSVLERLVGQLGAPERELLEVLALPNVFTEDLSAALYEGAGHDRLLVKLTDWRVIEQIGETDSGEALLRVHGLLRDALLDSMVEGPQLRRCRRIVATWLEGAAGAAATADYALGRERIAAFAQLNDSSVAEFAIGFIERQIAEFRLGRAREVSRLLVEVQWPAEDQARLAITLGRAEQADANYDSARDFYKRAGRALGGQGDATLRLSQLRALAECERLAGNSDAARLAFAELARRGAALRPRHETLSSLVLMRAAWGLALTEAQVDDLPLARRHLAEFERGLDQLEEPSVIREAERFGMSSVFLKRADVERFRAKLLRCEGELAGAERSAVAAIEQYGDGALVGRLLAEVTRSKVLLDSGEVDDAARLARSTAARFRDLGDRRSYATTLVVLADCAMVDERWGEAARLLDEVESFDQQFPFAQIYAELGRAEIARRRDRPETALEVYRDLGALAERLGSEIEMVVAHLGAAEAHLALKQRGEAFTHARLGLRGAERCGYAAPRVWARVIAARVDVPWQAAVHREHAEELLSTMTTRNGEPSAERLLLESAANSPVRLRFP